MRNISVASFSAEGQVAIQDYLIPLSLSDDEIQQLLAAQVPANSTSAYAPKPEDYHLAKYRLLSATMVGAGSWKATDFSNADVLKKAYKKLAGKPVYTDHDTSSDNWVGKVGATEFQDVAINSAGVKVPAGINGVLMIDAKQNPTIARGVASDVLNSNSVTVIFDWEPSHTFKDPRDFYWKVGELGEDDKMICRVVTKIRDFYETSLVWLGADPYAKKITKEDGTAEDVDTARVWDDKKKKGDKDGYSFAIEKMTSYTASMSEEDREKFKTPLVRTAPPTNSFDPSNAHPKDINMKKLLQYLQELSILPKELTASFMADAPLTEAQETAVQEAVNSFIATKDQEVVAKDAEITQLNALIAPYKEKLTAEGAPTYQLVTDEAMAEFTAAVEFKTANEPLLEFATKSFEDYRKDVRAQYALAFGDKATEASLALIDGAKDIKTLQGLADSFGVQIVSKFAPTCSSCGSKEVSFRSSSAESTTPVKGKSKSYSEIIEERQYK